MSGSYSSRLRAGGGGGGLGATTMLAAKVAFASAALAASLSLARMAVPKLVSSADAFLLKLNLFITVHVIIFVIWKLSDTKHFHAQQHKDPWAPTPHHPAPPLLTEHVVLSAMNRKVEFAPAARAEEYSVPPPVSQPHMEAAASPVDEGVISPGSCAGESCVTTESEEESASSAGATSAYVAAAESSRSVVASPAPVRKSVVVQRERAIVQRERVAVERGLSLHPPPAVAATDEYLDGAENDDVNGDANGDDDLEATWNAIMQKTRPATAPAVSSSSPARRSSPPPPASEPRPKARELSVGAAELSKRSEDFIKKIHNSFGRQQ